LKVNYSSNWISGGGSASRGNVMLASQQEGVQRAKGTARLTLTNFFTLSNSELRKKYSTVTERVLQFCCLECYIIQIYLRIFPWTGTKYVLVIFPSKRDASSVRNAACGSVLTTLPHIQLLFCDLKISSPVVTICTASLTFSNSTFCPHSCIYVFCVDLRINSNYILKQ